MLRITRGSLPKVDLTPLSGCLTKGLLLLLALILLWGCNDDRPTLDISPRQAHSQAVTTEDLKPVLRVAIGAMISPEITRIYYQNLLELIASRVGRRAVFSQRRTYAEINQLVKNQQVDIAFVCSGPYVTGHDQFGMELLVAPVVKGQQVYHSYFIVHQKNPITSFEELRGKRFAFTDPHSNSGYLVPTYLLSQQEETPATFFSETFYTNSHDNSIHAVAEGLTEGAAVDSLIWEFMNSVDPELTSQTKVIGKSPPYGIPPVVINPSLNLELKQGLKGAFLSIHRDAEARQLLRQIQIERFEEVEDSNYDSVREMKQWLVKFNRGDCE